MISFPQFLVIWNQQMNLRTPAVHFRIARWLEAAWETGDRNLLLMAFRSCGKSTLVGVFAAWLLCLNPGLRILVVAAEQELARKMVRHIKRIIERHPATVFLKPGKAEWWGSDSFTVDRQAEYRDPSLMAKGLSANITGSRADMIIYDDVEVPNTCDTAGKRTALRDRLAEIAYVLTPGGTQLYVGTPHTYDTIYADSPRLEMGQTEIFLRGYKRLTVPVLDESGASAWPERYTPADIEQIRTRSGPNKFSSQMMLIPVNITEGRLDPSLLHTYEEDVHFAPELQALFLGDTRLVDGCGWWDPAFGKAGGDRSVLAVVFADDTGRYYLHHVSYITTNPHEDTDEATQQCRHVARIAKALRLPHLCVEANGLGAFLPAILRNTLVKSKAPCTVQEIHSRRPKDIRIMEAFDGVLAARHLHVHASVLQTPFITEMREWIPGQAGASDDGLDAVAGALSRHAVRLKRLYGRGGHTWRAGRAVHTATSDFDV